MTNERLNREQCEKAFAAYIIAQKADPPDWGDPCPLVDPVDVGVFVRKGQFNDAGQYVLETPEEIPLPAVCVAAARVKPHEMGYPVVELHVLVINAVDETEASTRLSARFGFVSELLDESHQSELFTALNKPVGTDNRVVKNFHIFGFYPTEEMGQETERRWIDHLVYEVHCNPTDDAS
jgi:hypothetical protein